MAAILEVEIREEAKEALLLGVQAISALSDCALGYAKSHPHQQNAANQNVQITLRRIGTISDSLLSLAMSDDRDVTKLKTATGNFLYIVFSAMTEDRPRPLALDKLPQPERSCLQGVTNCLRELGLAVPPDLQNMPVVARELLKALRLGD